MKQPHVWVLEMLAAGKWLPTVVSDFRKVEAQQKLKDWRLGMSCERFRLVKYVREDAHANR